MWHLLGSGIELVSPALAGVLFDCWATREAHFWDVWRHGCSGKPELVTEILVHALPSGCLEGIGARFHGWGLRSRPALQKETFSASPCLPPFPTLFPDEKSEVSLRVSYRPAWGLDQTALGLKPPFTFSYLSCLPFLFCKLRTITETIQNPFKDLAGGTPPPPTGGPVVKTPHVHWGGQGRPHMPHATWCGQDKESRWQHTVGT